MSSNNITDVLETLGRPGVPKKDIKPIKTDSYTISCLVPVQNINNIKAILGESLYIDLKTIKFVNWGKKICAIISVSSHYNQPDFFKEMKKILDDDDGSMSFYTTYESNKLKGHETEEDMKKAGGVKWVYTFKKWRPIEKKSSNSFKANFSKKSTETKLEPI